MSTARHLPAIRKRNTIYSSPKFLVNDIELINKSTLKILTETQVEILKLLILLEHRHVSFAA